MGRYGQLKALEARDFFPEKELSLGLWQAVPQAGLLPALQVWNWPTAIITKVKPLV